jgi:hypothetical protein
MGGRTSPPLRTKLKIKRLEAVWAPKWPLIFGASVVVLQRYRDSPYAATVRRCVRTNSVDFHVRAAETCSLFDLTTARIIAECTAALTATRQHAHEVTAGQQRPITNGRKSELLGTLKRLRRVAFRNADGRGELKRKPCFVCRAKKAEAHHWDYRKPMEVFWLCRRHHVAVHNGTVSLPLTRFL